MSCSSIWRRARASGPRYVSAWDIRASVRPSEWRWSRAGPCRAYPDLRRTRVGFDDAVSGPRPPFPQPMNSKGSAHCRIKPLLFVDYREKLCHFGCMAAQRPTTFEELREFVDRRGGIHRISMGDL